MLFICLCVRVWFCVVFCLRLVVLFVCGVYVVVCVCVVCFAFLFVTELNSDQVNSIPHTQFTSAQFCLGPTTIINFDVGGNNNVKGVARLP